MSTQTKPIIAIPMGDPAGIGPEIVVKALSNQKIYDVCQPLVIGHSEVLKRAMDITHISLNINEIKDPSEGKYKHGTIDIVSLNNVDIDTLEIGKVQAQCGKAAYEYIETAVGLALDRKVSALATTPINKESLKAANVPFIGHTEILAALTNTNDPLTMFEVRNMRIFFLTRHLSLKDAIAAMTKERVCDYLIRCDQALQRLGVENRKIAVAALNPHGGENGLFGREEIDEILPGIQMAQEKGINAVGPVPADSVFHHALNGRYAAVLSLYHDQGHIAAKMADFERTISITNGLPFLRTSVDHGTAFDIAGKGMASSVSMEEAIILAAKYAPKFQPSWA
ncbi:MULTISPECIES: 4-hydroxythreonine-4-phosphate dehydrogenase PdxA [Geobacillus]|jgi:4-phospho-D-threonate 3-dehydrogenase / 4-phospho-D-erythronate 3-dehydrogenase|uniref:4-hydroxythreonine-4-phosphate dehydrogenase PdxA n=1 Tax=Geobacillus thermodenitrificans TaxID=33940 RepID=A0ABY9QBZ9_GEOTD|nr:MULTISPECIES: 4-hydroxythreonine-4-phosphate dehydrogenase PdxA [Geobacillus]ARP44270.1 4-hydroxythreonine-4-phosphate dehydrogenase [Geobacillus thermodenitrificans]ATO37707.1 4-hydroxythreonine-4-phosphate dehydrogenase PdxA [Geobacillus thermodenitrificans]MEC5188051.1 4-hydroxythreonine-4-phosphate dehydrogenase [Geobacillus thermodenitrificans]MED0663274.1 4-hydroxythreonine-4-phosphate dehydrogenase PdxA [Geobacillus thermodenitrificans]OQP08454.1 4-hydroxythreonine-4-phosphate dehydr